MNELANSASSEPDLVPKLPELPIIETSVGLVGQPAHFYFPSCFAFSKRYGTYAVIILVRGAFLEQLQKLRDVLFARLWHNGFIIRYRSFRPDFSFVRIGRS
jgi:hypothetical protein